MAGKCQQNEPLDDKKYIPVKADWLKKKKQNPDEVVVDAEDDLKIINITYIKH